MPLAKIGLYCFRNEILVLYSTNLESMKLFSSSSLILSSLLSVIHNFTLICVEIITHMTHHCSNRLTGFYMMGTLAVNTAQKMKFSVKDLFSKCDQIRSFLWIGHINWKSTKWKTSFFVLCNGLIPQLKSGLSSRQDWVIFGVKIFWKLAICTKSGVKCWMS